MKSIVKYSLSALLLLLVGACSNVAGDDSRAAAYADRLEQGEAVSAEEYAEMVDFYCNVLNRFDAEIEPLAAAYVETIGSGDSEAVAIALEDLFNAVAQLDADNPNVVRLGNYLVQHAEQMPDDVREKLESCLQSFISHYSNFETTRIKKSRLRYWRNRPLS